MGDRTVNEFYISNAVNDDLGEGTAEVGHRSLMLVERVARSASWIASHLGTGYSSRRNRTHTATGTNTDVVITIIITIIINTCQHHYRFPGSVKTLNHQSYYLRHWCHTVSSNHPRWELWPPAMIITIRLCDNGHIHVAKVENIHQFS